MAEIVYPEESYAIMGACFDVYNTIGTGLLEAVYQECLEYELRNREVPYIAKPQLEISYKGRTLTQRYEPDFVCFGKIILEIKAVESLNDVFRAQVHNYLRITEFGLGLLVNFASYPNLDYERIVCSKGHPRRRR